MAARTAVVALVCLAACAALAAASGGPVVLKNGNSISVLQRTVQRRAPADPLAAADAKPTGEEAKQAEEPAEESSGEGDSDGSSADSADVEGEDSGDDASSSPPPPPPASAAAKKVTEGGDSTGKPAKLAEKHLFCLAGKAFYEPPSVDKLKNGARRCPFADGNCCDFELRTVDDRGKDDSMGGFCCAKGFRCTVPRDTKPDSPPTCVRIV